MCDIFPFNGVKEGQVLHNDQYYMYLEYGIANINITNIGTCTWHDTT